MLWTSDLSVVVQYGRDEVKSEISVAVDPSKDLLAANYRYHLETFLFQERGANLLVVSLSLLPTFTMSTWSGDRKRAQVLQGLQFSLMTKNREAERTRSDQQHRTNDAAVF